MRITVDLVVMDTMIYFYSMPGLPLYPQYHTYKLGMPLSPIPSTPWVPISPSTSLPLHPSQLGFCWLAGCVNAELCGSCCTMMSGSEEWEPASWHTQKHISALISLAEKVFLDATEVSIQTLGKFIFLKFKYTVFKIYLSKHTFNLFHYKLILSNYLCLKS